MKHNFNSTINVIFTIVFLSGVVLSAMVYWRSESIINTSLELTNQQVPIYDTFQKFHNALSEQERHLYQYYATDNAECFSTGYLPAEADAAFRLKKLQQYFGDSSELTKAERQFTIIGQLADTFHRNMLRGQEAAVVKSQLTAISEARSNILAHTEKLRDKISQEVSRSQDQVASNSNEVTTYVILHFVVMLMISAVLFRAIRNSQKNWGISQRLALFTQRNPNPIFSLDKEDNVTFQNPATTKLLSKLHLPTDDVKSLIIPEIYDHKNDLQSDTDSYSRFEYCINDDVLSCELHWHYDIAQWDFHITDITAQKHAEQKLSHQATHHPETNLKNQYALENFVDNHINGENQLTPFSLTLVSVADFNRLQVNKGHENAQMIINQIATSLIITVNSKAHENASVFQIGDSHFVVIHENVEGVNDAKRLMYDLDNHIASSLFHYEYQPQLHYGITQYPKYAKDLGALLQTSRSALENITPESDTFFCFYNKYMGDRLSKEQKLTEDIKNAILNDEFQLHFQPQVDIKSKHIIGAEVLIRWPRESGWVSPAEFIPLAERSGLIIPLGNWILRTACEKAKALLDKGYKNLVTAVNISPKQFGRNDFLPTVEKILKETGLPPGNLELEITEGVIMYNESQTIDTLHRLKELGVMLAIDDFGTGYSSLSYLKQFPIDKLKIDQSFVREMHTDMADESIVRTVIDLGKNLNLKLIAEGVEEKAQWDLLDELGCHEIQGYYYSRPLPGEQFEDFSHINKMTVKEPPRLVM